jgi:cation transport regulator ChaC
VTAGTPLVLPFDTQPWFTTALSAGLVITLGSGVNCSGTIYYGQS